METLIKEKLGTNYVPEAKPNEAIENVEYLTGMTIQYIMDADVNKKSRIMALLLFVEFHC